MTSNTYAGGPGQSAAAPWALQSRTGYRGWHTACTPEGSMQSTLLVGLVVIVLVVLLGVWLFSQRRKSQQLQEHFGPEYEHAVHEHGSRSEAEQALRERAERVQQLHIRALSPEDSARYGESWRSVQTHFVDEPQVAVGEADRLVSEVMQARGYPMGNFEQRAADVSVDHPDVVENYRAAHAIAGRADQGEASTEDLRQAMVHYRSLFAELIESPEPAEVKR
jgi:hypothetical protein